MITLKSQRLQLDPLSAADLSELRRLSTLTDKDITRSQIDFETKGFGLFGLRLIGVRAFVGVAGLRFHAAFEAPELLCALDPWWRKQGLALEATRECLNDAFERQKLSRVIAGIDEPNLASAKLIERLGGEHPELIDGLVWSAITPASFQKSLLVEAEA